MKGVVVGGSVETTIPRLNGESHHEYRIVKWINGPNPGYAQCEYEGGGLWRGPRCVLYTELRKS